jgi:hypothetical protein
MDDDEGVGVVVHADLQRRDLIAGGADVDREAVLTLVGEGIRRIGSPTARMQIGFLDFGRKLPWDASPEQSTVLRSGTPTDSADGAAGRRVSAPRHPIGRRASSEPVQR